MKTFHVCCLDVFNIQFSYGHGVQCVSEAFGFSMLADCPVGFVVGSFFFFFLFGIDL